MSQYKQLTREQRYMIFRLKQENFSNRRIAGLIKVHYSTVYRELSRNIHPTIKAYRPAAAHSRATARRKTCRKPNNINPEKPGHNCRKTQQTLESGTNIRLVKTPRHSEYKSPNHLQLYQ